MATQKRAVQGLNSAAAAGLGLLAGALTALAVQRHRIDSLRVRIEHLEEAAQTQQHTNLATQQRLHWELLSKAIDNPELAEVLDVFERSLSPQKRRQFLFANALYTNQLFAYRVGNISREEFFGFVRGLLQNPIVRDYWRAGQHQRATMADESDEAKLGRMVDELLRQLEEADIDEWWVVGEPPAE
ncbi:DUF6082 family protein [Streptomyces phaeochromogenes]|uniref:DUF6082 family protein n=1 Tax=Streptomyces phaeochromogenes TaxID=1923 RepID=A0ABZ1H7S0_STRPH|nr:DUF6082 family protein [Streptomyces phaeochromogenes]MCX5604624.1 DUF6082 family protein [Streptomyces phaeochromogenes]WSD14622.1 DUF6082 family protein [Streptomyces phaeochromogenes]WSJ08528.1 DUF6082 family protein [Streptomyces phaeochromogenes]